MKQELQNGVLPQERYEQINSFTTKSTYTLTYTWTVDNSRIKDLSLYIHQCDNNLNLHQILLHVKKIKPLTS